MAGLERVFEVFDVEPGVKDPAEPRALPQPLRGELRLEGVGFGYAPDRPALHDVDLTIPPGTCLALVGPSGHGKTTLVKLLARFYDVERGRILLDGIDLRAIALGDLRAAMGFVSQEIVVFSGSVRENIAYGSLRPLRRVTEEEIVAAARAAQAWEFIERLPRGLDTTVGERGVRLSAGQRQRIALARLFLRNPRILLLDEPTSALDSVSEALFQDALEHLMAGRTSVIVAHRLSTIRNADRIGVVRDGRIVELGTHDELLAQGGVYAELYEKQQLLETDNGKNDQSADGDAPADETAETPAGDLDSDSASRPLGW
jgi:ABC-type multidrug transport system fused ATPase/permease subunit